MKKAKSRLWGKFRKAVKQYRRKFRASLSKISARRWKKYADSKQKARASAFRRIRKESKAYARRVKALRKWFARRIKIYKKRMAAVRKYSGSKRGKARARLIKFYKRTMALYRQRLASASRKYYKKRSEMLKKLQRRLSSARGKTTKLRRKRFVRRAICTPVNPCSAKRCSRGFACRVRRVRIGKSRRARRVARCVRQDPCKTVRCSRSSRCVVRRTATKQLLAYRWFARRSGKRHSNAVKRLRRHMIRRVRRHRLHAVRRHRRQVRKIRRRITGRRRARRVNSLKRLLIRQLRRYKKRAHRTYTRRKAILKRRLRQNLKRHFRRHLRRHKKYSVRAVCVKVKKNPCSRKRCPRGSRCTVRRQRPANYKRYLAIRRRYLRNYRMSRSRKTRRVRAAFVRKLRKLQMSYRKLGAFKFKLVAKCAKPGYCPRGYSRRGSTCVRYVEVCPQSYTRIRTRRGFRCIRFYRICPAGYMRFDNLCVKSCPKGTRKTSKRACRVVKSCSTFLNNTTCVKSCPKNTIAVRRRCRKCPKTAVVRAGKCLVRRINCRSGFQHKQKCVRSCPKGYYAFGRRCTRVRCPPGSKTRFSHRRRKVFCIRKPRCKKGSVFYAGSCRAKCPSGTKQRGWYCLRQCPAGTVRVGFRRQRCIRPYCRHRFRLGRRGCVRKCPVGYVGVRRTCKRVSLSCPSGYVRLGRSLCLKGCPAGFVKRKRRCEYNVCSGGSFRYRGTCMKSCPSGTIRRGRHCFRKSNCKLGRFDYRKICLTNCPPGHYRSYSTRTCVRIKRCSKGMIRFHRLCLKSCPLGFERARRTCKRRAICRDGFAYKGACLPSGSGCPRNTVLIRGSCVRARGLCPSGRLLLIRSSGARSCVRLCPRGFSADRRRGTCTMSRCPAKMFRYRKTCRRTCPKGFRADSNRRCVKNKKTVKCTGKSFKFSGRCVTSCPSGFVLRALKRRGRTIQYCRRSKMCKKGQVLVYSLQRLRRRRAYRYRSKCLNSKKACKRGYKLTRRVVRFMRLGRRVRRVLRVCTRSRKTCARGLFKYRGSCRKDCPKGLKSVIVRRSSRMARTCAPRCGKQFALRGKCVRKCPDGYRGTRFGRIRLCEMTCKKAAFSFRGKCVRRCPRGFRKRTVRIYSRRSRRVISRTSCRRSHCRRGYRLVYQLKRIGKARALKTKAICQRIKAKTCRQPKALFYGRCRSACPAGYFKRTRTVRGRRYGFCLAKKATTLCRRKRCKSNQICVVYRKSRLFRNRKTAFRRLVRRTACVPKYCKVGTYRYKNRCIKSCPRGYKKKTFKRTRVHRGRKHHVTLRHCTRKACKYPLARDNGRCVKRCPKSYMRKVFNIRFRYRKASYVRRYAVCRENLCTKVRCASGNKCIVKKVMAGRRRTKQVAACVKNKIDPCSRMRCRKGYKCKSMSNRSGRRRARCVRTAPNCRGGLVIFRRRCRRRCPKRYRVISKRVGKTLQRRCVRDACSKGRYFLFDRCTSRCPIGMTSRTKVYSKKYRFKYCQPKRCKGRRFRIGRRCVKSCPGGYRRRYYRTRRGLTRYCLSYICRKGYFKLGRRCVRKCGKNYRLRTYTRGKNTFGVCEPIKCRKGFVFIVGRCRKALKGCYDRAYTCKAMARRKRCSSKLVSYLCPVACGKCNPSKRKFCTCTSSGDPHYRTFDGKWISFQGKCKYLLAQSKLKKGSKCNFQVTAKNEARGKTRKVSWTRFVDISFHGIKVRLHQRRRVFINGKKVRRLPISLYPGGKKIRIYHSGRNVVAESKYCGMHIQFNGQSVAELHLPRSRYASKVQGICGNCNGNPKDDLRTRDGKDVSKLGVNGFAQIGQSFSVPDDSSKKHRCKVKPVPPTTKVCSPAMMKAVKSNKYCGMILDKSGPFGSCMRSKKVDFAGIFENCRFDVCEYKSPRNRRRAVCQSLESLYNACLAAGFSVKWRSRSFCPMPCRPNSVYSQKASGCPRTCSDIGRRRVCRLPDRDACVCKPGFVLNGRSCVPEKSCGAVVPIDVAFVVEGTDDISTKEFEALKSLVIKLLTKYRLSLESVRPSMVVFGRISPSVSLFSEHQDKADFMDYVRKLKRTGGSTDNLEAALRVVNKVLMQAIGGFRPQVPKYVIVLKKSSVPATSDKPVRKQLEKLRESKVRVMVVNLPRRGKSSVDPTMSGLTVISARMPPFTSIPAITKELKSTAGCPLGFKMEKDSCIDVNECTSAVSACHSDSTCVNLPGRFVCLCGDGLLHDRARGCVKPDKPKVDCPVEPKCKKGYDFDKTAKKCLDINECKENPCLSDRATCTNLAGSFRCNCPSGFEYNKYFGCVDVDECNVKKDPCMGAGKCINILGSYNCTCDTGFTYKAGVGCQDIDECASSTTNNCKGGSKCVNTAGSYKCSCDKGYRYSSESCVDIDECAENSKLCDASAMCVNQKPGYKCQCKLGDNWIYKAGEGCVPDESKGMTDRKVDFIFLIDVSDKLKDSIRDIQGFINGLLQQFNTKEVAGLSARATVVLMGKKGEANVAFSQSTLVGIADKINSLKPLGGKANLLQGMKTVSAEKSKTRRGSTVVVFLITASSIQPGDSSLTEIKRYSDNFKSTGKFFTVQLSPRGNPSQWSVLYTSDEISIFVTVIRSSEVIKIYKLFYLRVYPLITCPAGFVKNDGLCQLQTSTVKYCKTDTGELRPVGTTWQEECSQFKCTDSGVEVLFRKCLGYDGFCYSTEEYFPCTQVTGSLNWKCRCRLNKVTDKVTGKSIQSLTYQSIAAAKETMMTDKGIACVFPFKYRKKWHYSCDQFEGKYWCSFNRNHATGSWGYCKIKASKNRCTDPFDSSKIYVEGDRWNFGCNVMECTHTGLRRIPKCEASDKTCKDLHADKYSCRIGDKQHSNCLCVQDSSGWGKNEIVSGDKATVITGSGGAVVSMCVDISSGKKYEQGQEWTTSCFTYKCTATGGKLLQAKCQHKDGSCRNIGDKGFDCMISDKARANCECSKDASGNPMLVAVFEGRQITEIHKKTEVSTSLKMIAKSAKKTITSGTSSSSSSGTGAK